LDFWFENDLSGNPGSIASHQRRVYAFFLSFRRHFRKKGARWYIFIPKIKNMRKFGRALEWKSWYILWPFGIYWVNWYIFPFWYVEPRKILQPWQRGAYISTFTSKRGGSRSNPAKKWENGIRKSCQGRCELYLHM
jgi:hypothetical protein